MPIDSLGSSECILATENYAWQLNCPRAKPASHSRHMDVNGIKLPYDTTIFSLVQFELDMADNQVVSRFIKHYLKNLRLGIDCNTDL